MFCEETHGNKFLVKVINNCDRSWNSEEVSMFFFHMRVAIFITIIRRQYGEQGIIWRSGEIASLPPMTSQHYINITI